MNIKLNEIIFISVFIISLLVSVGWITGNLWITKLSSDWVSMKMTTSVVFMMTSLSLAVSRVDKDILVGSSKGILLVAASTIIFSQMWANWYNTTIHLDFLSFDDDGIKSVVPGRPSLETMINFTLIISAICIPQLTRIVGPIVTISGILGIVGYIINLPALYGYTATSSAMAIHTCLNFALMGIACSMFDKESKM